MSTNALPCRSIFVIAMLGLGLIAAPTDAAETNFGGPDLGFSMTIPDGWKPISEKKLQASAHQKDLGDDGAVLGGFAKGSTNLTPPYVVIDAWGPALNLRASTWDNVEQQLGLTTIEKAREQGLLDGNDKYTGKDLSPSILDKDRHLIIMQGELPKDPASTKTGLYLVTASFVGADDFVRIHAYLPANQSKALLPEVERMLASFGFEPGEAFQPAKPVGKRSSSTYGFRTRRLGVFGGGGIIGLIALFFLRRLVNE